MTITTAFLKGFRAKFGDVLDEFAKQEGITINQKAITYSDNSFNIKLEVTLAGDKSEAEQIQWDKSCYLFSLKPEHYGQTVQHGDGTFKLVGLKPRSPKYPLIAERLDNGQRYKLAISNSMKTQLGIPIEAYSRW